VTSAIRVIARDAAGKATRFRQDIDALAIDDLKLDGGKLTPEGYFVAEDVPISRPGIQEYSALELGLDVSFKTVRLYRPPEEVFSPESMASADRKPTTYYHPPGAVDSSNWREHATGHMEDPYATADQDFLRVKKYIVNDAGHIAGMASGTKQISCGYDFTLDMTPGATLAGEAYDGVQREIRINHGATVYAGRCGAGCAVGDCAGNEACACQARGTTNPKPGDSIMRKITVDGIDITLEETNAALVEKALAAKDTAIATQTKRATDAEGALSAQGEAMKKLAADHSAKVAELEAKIKTPEQQKAELAELVKVTADAKAIAPDFAADGLSAEEIRIGVLSHVVAKDEARKVVVQAMLGGTEPAKASPAVVRGAFDAALALGGSTEVVDGSYERQVRDALSGAGGRVPGGKDGKEWTGQEIYNYRLQHGGKNPPNYAG
jgi:hypothetical protein